jgi:hypothetical protein
MAVNKDVGIQWAVCIINQSCRGHSKNKWDGVSRNAHSAATTIEQMVSDRMGEIIRKINFACVTAAGSDPERFVSSLASADGWAVLPSGLVHQSTAATHLFLFF